MKKNPLIEERVESPAGLGVGSLHMEGFRNYSDQLVELSPGFNIVAGPNAQGKTNLLEALYLLSSTRLLRGSKDAEAVQEGRDKARVSATLSNGSTDVAITLERGTRKRAFLNGLGLPRASDILGRLPCVCISSADMPIATGEPADRRLFLDLYLSQIYPSYLRHLTLYKRALEQRNALLKAAQQFEKPSALFEPWEMQLAEHGANLRQARLAFIDSVRPHASSAQAWLGSDELLELRYVAKDDGMMSDDLLRQMESVRGLDIARGSTTIGPHRDDLLILVDGREARVFGSQGQQRTSVIALKLGSHELAREQLGAAPLLLLDDILSDLDQNRRQMLVRWVLDHAGQAVLTCTEASAAGEDLISRARVFSVRSGTIQ